MEFDDSEFDSSDMPDRLNETGPPDSKDSYAFLHLPALHSFWLACTVALVVGLALGRLSAETNSTPMTVAPDASTQQVSSVDGPSCPARDVCRHYSTSLPALLSRLIVVDFPDTNATEIVTVDDPTNRVRKLVVTARLGRGLVLDATAFNRPSPRSTMTPWVFVTVGGYQHHPDHAVRTMISRRGDATVHLRVAVTRASVPQRPGRADFVCAWCVRSAARARQAARISGQLDRAYPSLVAAVGDGVQAMARSRALAAFILNPQP